MKDPINDFQEGQCSAWDNLCYHDKIEITSFIFGKITASPNPSFRRLIYSRLGLMHDSYFPLYSSGGMQITNAIIDYQDTDDEDY